jgi:hypothetical protein
MPRRFEIRYNPQIYKDIQKAVDFYTEQTQSNKLGRQFIAQTEKALSNLSRSALHYQIRYSDIRLIPIPSFPYCAHYRVCLVLKIVYSMND